MNREIELSPRGHLAQWSGPPQGNLFPWASVLSLVWVRDRVDLVVVVGVVDTQVDLQG